MKRAARALFRPGSATPGGTGGSSGEPDDAAPTGQAGPPEPEGHVPSGPEKESPPSSRRLEIIAAGVAVAIAGTLVLLARAIEVRMETDGIDPRWWPELIGITALVLAVALLLVALLRPPFSRADLERATGEGWVRLVAAIALTTAFIAVWPAAGFLVAAPVFLLVATLLFGGRGWKTLVIYPLLLPVGIYLLFDTVLEVPL